MSEPKSLLVDRYELGKVIGRGGMAEVHMGRDLRLGRTVAIKILRADLARDPAFQARFRREAQSAASLNHPAIVAVYDTGEETVNGMPVPFIVMEFVEGSTLRDLLSSGKRLLPVRAMEVTASVLTALDYSHRQGIVHRDIKPGNVMLTTDGRVKVMDFGIARALADTGAMTQTAAVMGTAQYLSPEQAKGEQVDTRSDLYSTGCLLYELLTGQPPFSGDSPVSVAYQHVREEAPSPSQIDPEVPASADAVTAKALMKDREQRYQSAAEFRTDLEQVIRGQDPVTALLPPLGAGGAAVPAAATTTALPAYGAGAAPAGATAVLGAQGQMGPGQMGTGPQAVAPGYNTLPPNAAPAKKRGMGAVVFAVIVSLALLGLVIAMINRGNNDSGQASTPTNSNSVQTSRMEVPDVVSKTESAARALLSASGWRLADSQFSSSDQYEKGTVISQTPSAGTPADPRTVEIKLTVSSGPRQDDMPDLVGSDSTSASKVLQNMGAVVSVNYQDSPQRKDTVLSTEPAAGSSITSGTKVTMVVASGKNTLPDVKNQTYTQAMQTLKQAGFSSVQVSEVAAQDGETPDVVSNMSPSPNSSTALSTTITLTVPQADQSGGGSDPTQPTEPTEPSDGEYPSTSTASTSTARYNPILDPAF